MGRVCARAFVGLVEISFGFSEPDDAYLGFLMLGPWARGQGTGAAVLCELKLQAGSRPLVSDSIGGQREGARVLAA